MGGIQHWLSHWVGADNPSGAIYLFGSGWFANAAFLSAPLVVLRKHNCHAKGCWRIGRFPVEGTAYALCRKCHPDDHKTAEEIGAIHAERNPQ